MPIAGQGLRFESGSLGFADRLASGRRTPDLQLLAERIEKQLESMTTGEVAKRDRWASENLDQLTFGSVNGPSNGLMKSGLMSGPTNVAQFGFGSYAGLDNS